MTTTLLAVDDSKTMRRVLEITFAGENYKTVLAESAEDALGKLRAERPNVALIDHGLGGGAGYDLCKQIKREAPGVGVIILSSKQTPYDRARGASVGADDFIDKPFDTQQLIDKVGALVRKLAEAPRAAPPPPARPAAQPTAAATAPTMAARPRAETLSYGGAVPPAAGSRVPTAPGRAPTPTITSAGAPPPHAPPPPARPAEPHAPTAPTPVTGSPFGRSAQARPAPAAPAAAPPAARAAPAPAAPAAPPAPPPAAAPVAAAAAAATGGDGQLASKLAGIGLTQEQVQAVLALSREVVEKVVWEVVPVLAETMIKEELKRLTGE